MSTVAEIEAAIAGLPPEQMAELSRWLEDRQAIRAVPPAAEAWLQRARGAARPDATTAGVLALTRGEG